MQIRTVDVEKGAARVFAEQWRGVSGYADLTGHTLTARITDETGTLVGSEIGAPDTQLAVGDTTTALFPISGVVSGALSAKVYGLELTAAPADGKDVKKRFYRLHVVTVPTAA